MPKKASIPKHLSRKEQQNLDIEIGFLEGLIRRAPDDIDALQVLGNDYTRRGLFDEGLRIDERLVKLRPSDAMVHYNLACSYSLTNQVDLAADALLLALKLGYRDFRWLLEDPDLENLRCARKFRTIQTKIRALRIRVR